MAKIPIPNPLTRCTKAPPAQTKIVRRYAAASIASTVLTTEAVVSEKKEDKPMMPAGGDGAGMGGMY